MRFIALLLASVWVLAVSLAVPCPRSLRLYFAANLLYTAGLQPFLYWYGETSETYATAYYIGASVHLLGALNVMRTELSRRWHFLLGATIALIVVGRAYAGLPHPLEGWQQFYLLEGGALALAGATIGYSAARAKLAGILLTLAFLWLALATFRLGFVLNWQSETWLQLNRMLPTVFVCGALGWIGLKLLEGRPADAITTK